MPVKWIKPALNFDQVRSELESKGILFENAGIPSIVGGRFSRDLGNGRVRKTSSFHVEDPTRKLAASLVRSWCQSLDLDSEDLGIDEW